MHLISPGPTRVDVNVEQGSGITYRALCAKDMDANYAALANGQAAGIAEQALVARGTVDGVGARTNDFRVDGCKFYLVVSSVRGSTTIASLRVRA